MFFSPALSSSSANDLRLKFGLLLPHSPFGSDATSDATNGSDRSNAQYLDTFSFLLFSFTLPQFLFCKAEIRPREYQLAPREFTVVGAKINVSDFFLCAIILGFGPSPVRAEHRRGPISLFIMLNPSTASNSLFILGVGSVSACVSNAIGHELIQ